MGTGITVVVERTFEEPIPFDRVSRVTDPRLALRRGYVSLDGKSSVAIFDASAADAVEVLRPAARVWVATVLGAPQHHEAADGYSTVVVERDLPQPMPAPVVEAMMTGGRGCLEANGVDLLRSHLSEDGLRMVCVFQALDAESVRRANRELGVPVARAWTARVHAP